MSWHLIIHYLDLFRHDNAFAWNWVTWIGNVTAGMIIAAFMSAFYPPFRRAIAAFFTRHFDSVHDKLDAHHRERLEQATAHHAEALALADERHAELKKAINGGLSSAKKAPAAKRTAKD